MESEAFLKRICRELKGNRRERTAVRRLKGRARWRQIVGAVEEAKGEGWEQFCLRHGDWGRDAALWLGRSVGRLSLRELGEFAGGMDYAAVGQAVARFGKRVEREAQLRQRITRIQKQMSNVEM